ncbi:MAG TPA: cytochrome c biogenesis protein CcsA [Methylococcales bacterium]
MPTYFAIEKDILLVVVALYLAAAIVGFCQLSKGSPKLRYVLVALIAFAVSLESTALVFRAVEIKAIPLTVLFESMMVLTIAFGLIYIAFSVAISQSWFGSVMSCVLLAMTIATLLVFTPAAEPSKVAKTPWAVSHGLSMVLASAMIMFSSVSAYLFLLGNRRLKAKRVSGMVGKVPNIERMEQLNLFGLRACFVLLTFGIVSGIGLGIVKHVMLELTIGQWLLDPKIICIGAAWVLITLLLFLRHFNLIGNKTTAYLTLVVFFLIFFAIIAVTAFGITRHVFGGGALMKM